MIIDCATCPARNRACADCLMQVLFEPVTRDFGPGRGDAEGLDGLLAAVAVLTDTALISAETARSARADILAGQSESVRLLPAVDRAG